MKSLRSHQSQFVTLLVIILFWSCDNGKLSNSKIEQILKAEYPRYITTNIQISDHSLSPYVSTELKLLYQKGLANYNYIPPGNRGYGCYGELTEVGSKYLVSILNRDFVRMAIAKIEFDKLISAKEIPAYNAAQVEYSEKIVSITPVGEIYNDINIGKTYKNSATFSKYNDGWRLEELSTNAVKMVISENIQTTAPIKTSKKVEEQWDVFIIDLKNAIKNNDFVAFSKLSLEEGVFETAGAGATKKEFFENFLSDNGIESIIEGIGKKPEIINENERICGDFFLFLYQNGKWYWSGIAGD